MTEARQIPCDHVIAQLWEYLDGDVTARSAERVHEHLELCARCFPEYDFRKAYLRFMRRCSSQQGSPELRRRIFQAILEEERRDKGGSAPSDDGRCAWPSDRPAEG